MADAVQSSIDLVFGHKIASDVSVKFPCDATMSRSTYKLDLTHMLLRRQQWSTWTNESKTRNVHLGDLTEHQVSSSAVFALTDCNTRKQP